MNKARKPIFTRNVASETPIPDADVHQGVRQLMVAYANMLVIVNSLNDKGYKMRPLLESNAEDGIYLEGMEIEGPGSARYAGDKLQTQTFQYTWQEKTNGNETRGRSEDGEA